MAAGPHECTHDGRLPGAGWRLEGRPLSASDRRPSRFPLPLDKVVAGATPLRAGAEVLRPQRPLQEAAREAMRRQPPAGLGLDSAAVRARMVTRLAAEGVRCEPVLAAMGEVPRHLFVDTALVPQAYEDTSLPIGLGQTISKPAVVARMLALLVDRPGGAAAHAPRAPLGRVLEIGTGCGYQAAVLARLARSVISVERLKPLHDRARANLDAAGVPGVRLVWGDGRLGHGPNAPYDTIISAAGGEELPSAWVEQLAVGGRLVAPMHSPADGGQVLVVLDRTTSGLRRSAHDAVHFVPLKSGAQ
ncbi:MAG: protein-L-isoaspartate(D-aspartate) O-methyltransferase Pcm [Pseudomonadota bacterium]